MGSSDSSAGPPEVLARLVLRCRELDAHIKAVQGSLPSPAETPFLHRQLQEVVHRLQLDLRALANVAETPADKGSALRALFASRKRRPDSTPSRRYDLQGNAWTIPVTELVSFLSQSCKSGVLWVTTTDETFVLEFLRGNLVHATSTAPPKTFRLGEILLREKMLEPSDLENELVRARAADDLLGSFLVRSGRLSATALQRALFVQVQELFHRLMDAENATYGFQDGLQMPRSQGLEVNITQLLLESARKKDEERLEREPSSLLGLPKAKVADAAPESHEDEPEEEEDGEEAEAEGEDAATPAPALPVLADAEKGPKPIEAVRAPTDSKASPPIAAAVPDEDDDADIAAA
jgi:hypothetical protein